MEKCSNAFAKYVDAVFVIENCLLTYTNRTGKYNEMSLTTKRDENLLLIGICTSLIHSITQHFKFANTKKAFTNTMLKIC